MKIQKQRRQKTTETQSLEIKLNAIAISHAPNGPMIYNTSSYNHSTAFEIHYRRTVVPDESLALGHLLSRELLKLSLVDRTAIQEEIHGVKCLAVRETPELIRKGLEAFRIKLDNIPKDQKRTYEECRVRAMLYQDEEDSCYALHDAFKLRFLRVELFDAAKAVQRFVSYLEFVREFWGADIALKRLIRFSDFNKAEMKLFRKGYFQVLPFRDRSGRRVITLLGGFTPEIDRAMRLKAIFYLTDVLTRTDVESQQRGTIMISEAYCWAVEDSGRDKRTKSTLKFPNPNESLHFTKQMFESIPNRMIAIHNCWPDRPAFRVMSKLLTIHGVSGSTQRLRLKFHNGDELENRYRLKSYGIPIELLPITETGSIKMINHNYWIKTRKHVEQGIDTNVTIVECPGSNDTVFRQGTSSMENPGNVKCRDMILSLLEDRDREMYTSHYHNRSSGNNNNNAAKQHNEIVERLVDTMRRYHGGRFLEWDKYRSSWIQMVDRQKVKQKVSVLLHSISKRYRKRAAASNGGDSIMNSIVSSNSDFIVSNSDSSRDSVKRSPSMLLSEDLDVLAIKLNDEDEIDAGANTGGGGLGPYTFLEGGRSLWRQKQCCRIENDVPPSQQQISRKRKKKV
jgi:hypothetical protein